MNDSSPSPFSLAGRVAVITGAGSGIGRGAAIAFAKAGATLVLADINNQGLAETAQATGVDATCFTGDLSIRENAEKLADMAVTGAGRIDAWANVAGTTTASPLLDITEEMVERIVGINLNGVLWGCIAAARAMKQTGGGSIINISSTGGTSPPPGQTVYAATKGAVNAITRNVALEMGPFGIRANTISPGWIETPLAGGMFRREDGSVDPEKREQVMAMLESASPLGMTGEPGDIANAMVYLASDASRFMTGQNVLVNGGTTMV